MVVTAVAANEEAQVPKQNENDHERKKRLTRHTSSSNSIQSLHVIYHSFVFRKLIYVVISFSVRCMRVFEFASTHAFPFAPQTNSLSHCSNATNVTHSHRVGRQCMFDLI